MNFHPLIFSTYRSKFRLMTLLFFSMVFLNLTSGILGLRYLRNIDDD